jgi:hypothetical protein
MFTILLVSSKACRARNVPLPDLDQSLTEWLRACAPDSSFEAREENGVLSICVWPSGPISATPGFEVFLSASDLVQRFEPIDTDWRLGAARGMLSASELEDLK